MDNTQLFAMSARVGFSLAIINVVTMAFSQTGRGIVDWSFSNTAGLRGGQ
jgi:hypothetical protein